MPKKHPAPIPAPRPERRWLGPTLAAAAAVAVLAIALSYLSGAMSEATLGTFIAVAIGLAVAGRVIGSMLENAASTVARLTIVVLAVATLTLAIVPVMLTIFPGSPAATGRLAQVGDTLPLPGTVQGPVRLLIHGVIDAPGNATVDFELGGTASLTEGRLERSVSTSRVGRRGVAHVTHDRNSEFLDAKLAKGAHQLRLERIEGPLAGALDLAVYPDRFPLSIDVVVAVAVLLALAFVAVRMRVGTDTVAAAGVALAFGAVSHQFVTPDAILRPLIGALIVGAIVGASSGGLAAWLARKVLPGPSTL